MEGKRWKQRDTKIWSELGYEESWGRGRHWEAKERDDNSVEQKRDT